MQNVTQQNRALDLLHKRGMLRASELDAQGVPRMVLSRLTASGRLERVGRGLYRLAGSVSSEHEGLVTVAAKVPQAVFCLLTALQFHELTTQLPRQIWIAMPRGSHTPHIEYPPVKMVQMARDVYSSGVEQHERDGATLSVYCIAKTVVDCFKHRNKIGLDVALEALKEVRTKRLASVDDLWLFAKISRMTNVMRPYLEATE